MEKLFRFLFGDVIREVILSLFDEELSKKISDKVNEVYGDNLDSLEESLNSLENGLTEIKNKVDEVQEQFDNICGDNTEEPIEEPIEEPVEEPVDNTPRLADGYPNFRRLDQETEWAQTIEGQRVGYVRLENKYGLMIDAGGKVLDFYQNSDLRGSSDTNASRIIAPAGGWIMVWASGTDYHVDDDRVRPYQMDGGRLAYIVMKEQMIDGVQLDMDLPEYGYDPAENPTLYIPDDQVVEVFYQEKAIDWSL